MANQDNLKKANEIVGREYIKELAKQLIYKGKKSSGALIASLDYNVVEAANGFTIQILAADYLQNVDQGRRKGAKPPPISAIIPWIRRKGIRIGKTEKSTAFAIARGISKNGIKPTRVIKAAKESLMKNVGEILKKGAIEDINNVIEEIFKNIN